MSSDDKTGFDDGSGLPYVKADIINSIIYGLGADMSHGELDGTDVRVHRCLLKSSGTDDDFFTDCLWDVDPLYRTVRSEYFFDYRLKEGSPAIGAANPELVPADCATDGYGIPRGSAPDLGAYVYTQSEQ